MTATADSRPTGREDPPFPSVPSDRQRAAGKALRKDCPRASHAEVGTFADDRDIVALIRASSENRLENLLPLRYSRMLESPFAFYRGSAVIQAEDLAQTPASGITVQACGDAHLLNYGGFATPERDLIFDINDFDETFPAPFEWDVKRLCASVVLAARWRGFSKAQAREAATATVARYHEMMCAFADRPTMEVWYNRIDYASLEQRVRDEPALARMLAGDIKRAQDSTAEHVYGEIVRDENGVARIVDQPPLLFHSRSDLRDAGRQFLEHYARTLRDDYQALLSRFRFVDAAMKVVGVGSVGTRCFIVLMLDEHDHPLFLQVKEARASVLERHHGPSPWKNNGERVVAGQHLMQAASDIFLGWAQGPAGRNFYVRQLRDMKISVRLERLGPGLLARYGGLCGEALARAHAKAGQASTIAGYLGTGTAFDAAVAKYAGGYADRVERDYDTFRRAARRGDLPTETSGSLVETMIH